ncbi:hypothetical protein ACFIOY_23555 [Bradyrhizobium sp. TZ2]
MTKCKILSLGLLGATMLATPVMAQTVYQEPGVGYYPNSGYVTGGYGVRADPGPGYYRGNRFYPAPRVGAFASEPWTDGSSYGYVERPY